MLCKILASFLEKHLRYEGGGQIAPPPADFKHLQTFPVIGLRNKEELRNKFYNRKLNILILKILYYILYICKMYTLADI